MKKGIYVNDKNHVVYCGNRKPKDPPGMTWIDVPSDQLPEDQIRVDGKYLYEWVDGSIKKVSDYNKLKQSEPAKAALMSTDTDSIRSIREFILLKFKDDPDLPPFLLTHEDNAKTERAKLK